MASIADIIRAANPFIKEVTEDLVRTFTQNFIDIYKSEAVPIIKREFMRAYDELAEEEEGQMGPRIRGKDPTSLKNLRPLFERQITSELNNNISVKGDELVIQVMNKDKLGFGNDSPSDGPLNTVDVLGYYIDGMIGEFAFITPEHYKARGRVSSKPLGRLGAGFLIPKDRYKSERWAEVTKVPFEDVRHAISGQTPYKGFEAAISSIDFSSIISSVVEKTISSISGTVRG